MSDEQSQEAGDNSQLVQAREINIYNGIDEKRAREIFSEMYFVARKDFAMEALTVANDRVNKFEDQLMGKIATVEGAINAFGDPSFLLLLTQAHKAAAATDRPTDYNLLSELLIHRILKGDKRETRAGVSLAIKIVDEISDEALQGLTVAAAIEKIIPVSGNILQGLDILNTLYGNIIYSDLPQGNSWVDHLEVLNAFRVSTFGTLRKINQIFPERLSGYVAPGIEIKSENYNKAIGILTSAALSSDILVPHELNNAYVRVPVIGQDEIKSLCLANFALSNGQLVINKIPLSEKQKSAVQDVYKLYSNDQSTKDAFKTLFMEEWNKRTNLLKVKEWWDAISSVFNITSVGRALAYANAKRCDNSWPDID